MATTIFIEELKKPDLESVKMNCDEIIDAKLMKYPMVQDVWAKTSFNVICGKMGQGKTSLITNLVTSVFKKCFDRIYIFIPTISRKSIDNDIYGRFLPEDQIYDDLTIESLNELYDKLKASSDEKEFSLIIIDDFQTQLKNTDILLVLKKIITKMRHLRCTIFLLQQNYTALDKSLRQLVSNIILFNLGKSQLTKIFEEVITIKKSVYDQLIDFVYTEKNDWMLLNVNGNKNIYKNFDQIIIKNSK